MAAQGLELPLLDTTFELLLVSSVWQFHGHILLDLKKRTCPSFLQSLTLLYRISDSKNEKNNYQFIFIVSLIIMQWVSLKISIIFYIFSKMIYMYDNDFVVVEMTI